MHLSASLDAIQAGDRVRFLVHLINDGDTPVTIPVGEDDTVEVSLRRNDAELWRWTAGIRRGSRGGTTITPTDRVRWACEWPDPLFGTYTGVATIEVGDTTLEARSPVTVTKGVAEAASPAGPDRPPITSERPDGDDEPASSDTVTNEHR